MDGLASVGAYLGITTLVGHLLKGKQSTIKDFFLGGRLHGPRSPVDNSHGNQRGHFHRRPRHGLRCRRRLHIYSSVGNRIDHRPDSGGYFLR